MSNIAILLIGLATILNGINVSIILKRLDEDETVLASLIDLLKGASMESRERDSR